MKLNMVAYLIKKGITEEQIIDLDKGAQRNEVLIDGEIHPLYLVNSVSRPKWSDLFISQPTLDSGIFNTKSIKGLLLIESKSRLLAFTFGHGRSLIIPKVIERGFGLRITLNLGDPSKIKSVDKSTLEKVALKTRSQTSRNTIIADFDFEFDHEILKSICAIVDRKDDELEMVSGCDSVSLYTEVDTDDIPSIAERLLDAYFADNYKKNYPWVDFIQAVSDPSKIEELNSQLLDSINAGEYDDIWISTPEIVDYDDFSGFVYKKMSKKDPCYHSELFLSDYISESNIKIPTDIDALKRRKIFVYNASGVEKNAWSIYQCLNGEATIDDDTFILNDGHWYGVEDSFASSVNSFFSSLKNSNLDFPPYHGMKEGDYLRHVADGENYALLDQKWIYPQGTGNRIEFCDLMSKCDAFIHVKKYGSSSVLSHLFSQASVAMEFLMNDQSVQEQVNKHLEETYLMVNYKHDETPRRYRIVLAVMQQKAGSLHLPFFSKVNLRHHARRLVNMGFSVEIAKIDIGGE